MSGIIVEEQSFASVLKSLMKKYRISGQKIADRIGKSQKTVSRYANGEVVPKKKYRRQVLQAVSEIAGYSTEELVAEGKEIKRVWELKTVTLGSARREAYKERREQAEKWAVRVFALLPEEKQRFMLDFFDLYAELKMYEMEMVDNFRRIPAEKEQVIMDVAYFLAMRKDQEKKDALEQYRVIKIRRGLQSDFTVPVGNRKAGINIWKFQNWKKRQNWKANLPENWLTKVWNWARFSGLAYGW